MSRIRQALKRAEVWQEQPAAVQPVPFTVIAFGAGWEQTETNPHEEESARATKPFSVKVRCFFSKVRTWINPVEAREEPGPRRLCQRQTRQGHTCRDSAMANGYCALHGGARGETTPVTDPSQILAGVSKAY